MVGIRGKVGVLAKLGGNLLAGLHHSRRKVKAVFGYGNAVMEFEFQLRDKVRHSARFGWPPGALRTVSRRHTACARAAPAACLRRCVALENMRALRSDARADAACAHPCDHACDARARVAAPRHGTPLEPAPRQRTVQPPLLRCKCSAPVQL